MERSVLVLIVIERKDCNSVSLCVFERHTDSGVSVSTIGGEESFGPNSNRFAVFGFIDIHDSIESRMCRLFCDVASDSRILHKIFISFHSFVSLMILMMSCVMDMICVGCNDPFVDIRFDGILGIG